MTNAVVENKTVNTNEYNVFDKVPQLLFRQALTGAKEFDMNFRFWNDLSFVDKETDKEVKIEGVGKVFFYLKKVKALDYSYEESVDLETGKKTYKVHVKDFNPFVRTISKSGKEYNVFFKQIG